MDDVNSPNKDLEEELQKSIHSNEDEIMDELIKLSFQFDTGDKIKWKTVASKNGAVIETTSDSCFKSFDSSPNHDGLHIIRGYTDVQGITPQQFYDLQVGFQDSHIVYEKEFEKTCTESKVTKYIDIDHCIGYSAYNPGYFISPRDFCFMRTRRLYKDYKIKGEIYEEVSIGLYYDITKNNKYYTPEAKEHIRASSIGGRIFFRKNKDSPVRLIFISRLNLKGWVPLWLVNLTIGSKCDSINELKKNMKIVVDREMKKREKLNKEKKNDDQDDKEDEKEK